MARKKEKFSRYDVADYLKSEEDLAAYLDACMDEAGDDACDPALSVLIGETQAAGFSEDG